MKEAKEGLEILVLLVSLGAIVFQAGAGHARGKAMATAIQEVKAMVQGVIDKCGSCRDQLDHEDQVLHDRVTKQAIQLAKVEENVKHKGRG